MRVRSRLARRSRMPRGSSSGRRGCRADTWRRCRRSSGRRRWRTVPSSPGRARPSQAAGARCRSRSGRSQRTPRRFRPPRHPRMQGVRSRHCLGDEIVHALDTIGEDLGDAAQHVGFSSQIRPRRIRAGLRGPGPPRSDSAQRAAGAARCSRMFAQAMFELEPCSRNHQMAAAASSTIPSSVVIFDCSSRLGLVLLDKINRAVGIARGQRMVDGLVEVAVFGEPRRCACGGVARPGRGRHVRVDDAGTRRTSGGTETSPGRRRSAAGTGRVARLLRASPARASPPPAPTPAPPQVRSVIDVASRNSRHLRFQRVKDVLCQELADHVVRTGQTGPPG